MKTYNDIVNEFKAAADAHLAINYFAAGTIDKLDATTQNVTYPFVFLRPLTSLGVVLNDIGYSGERTLTFELYALDVPKLTDEDTIKIMSNAEQYCYDLIGWFNRGTQQQDYQIGLNNITPVNEAFNDRVSGWVANLTITTPYVLDFCNFPYL